ncbi:acyl-CoA dehydrogenase [Actinomadura roseirufa]|uniref:acyl-CoA dehydrogenase n=1 Tax=Actinomadura roseirufa TaxID=2094049 RepID=UPI0010415B18|nr:acyl-CoA dehydrogenase [Actinomadura roseirufa]
MAAELDLALGDPLRPSGPLTFAQAVADDQDEQVPELSLRALRDWGYQRYQVPESVGGRLSSLEELMSLGRVVARRDPAVAVIANSALAAAMPVWLAGDAEQRKAVADSVLGGRRVALGLTEPDHGADLLASEVTGSLESEGYRLNGTKWLINNVRPAQYLCLLLREPEREGLRSLSLLLVDLDTLDPATYELLPRIHTHGVRGADIAGITFRNALVPASARIGRPGRGLEITAQSLLVTRTLIPGLSLGALDTGLRCTADFVRRRHLYGKAVEEIPYVQDELAAVFLDAMVAEAVSRSCVRILHFLPELSPVSSAVAKYLVPHMAEKAMGRLARVLGARYFLREGHWSGIFEKLLRDVRLFGLFDGSEPVVLSALAAQVSCLAERDVDPRRADDVFRPGHATVGNAIAPGVFDAVADDDPVTTDLLAVCDALDERSRRGDALRDAAGALREAGADLFEGAQRSVDPRSQAGQRLGERYARVFAAVCWAKSWLADSARVPPEWAAAGLLALLRPHVRMPQPVSAALFGELTRQFSHQPSFPSPRVAAKETPAW